MIKDGTGEEQTAARARERAVLLTANGGSTQDKNASKLLSFFGIASEALSVEELTARATVDEGLSGLRLIASSDALLELADSWGRDSAGGGWRQRVHSVFVYAGSLDSLRKTLEDLDGGRPATLLKTPSQRAWTVTDESPSLCGPMSGLRVDDSSDAAATLVVHDPATARAGLVSNEQGVAFLKAAYGTVPVFVSTSPDFVDIDEDLQTPNFDIRTCFLSSFPLVAYAKWAFPESVWEAPEPGACLIVDDPPLRARHGFLRFDVLLELMREHEFSSNIAFIPWNWRRSAPKVVRLFTENTDRYSLSIHGCDHTGSEFGTLDPVVLVSKANKAIDRMSRHESRTGVAHDRIMVFPQGVFSSSAMDVLKRSDFAAAVNTEVFSVDPDPQAVRVRDVWDVAVMNYSGFALFTRRYPSQGVENFAFDLFLGKPCLLVIHHDWCRDRCAPLLDVIDRLNSLALRPTWRSLGEIVARACRQRRLSPDTVEVEMFGSTLRVENDTAYRTKYRIYRREPEPSVVREVRSGVGRIAWRESDGGLVFELDLAPGQCTVVSVEFHKSSPHAGATERLNYKLRTMLRRHLCEFRDNYVATSRLLTRLLGLES